MSPFPSLPRALALGIAMLASLPVMEIHARGKTPVVRFDERAAAFSRTLPHAKPFIIEVETPAAVETVKLQIWVQEDRRCRRGARGAKSYDGNLLKVAAHGAKAPKGRATTSTARRRFAVRLPGLRYATRYCVSVDNYQRWDAALERHLLTSLDELPALQAKSRDAGVMELRKALAVPAGFLLRSTFSQAPTHRPELLVDVLASWLQKQKSLRDGRRAFRAAAAARETAGGALDDLRAVDLRQLGALAFTTGLPSGLDVLLDQQRRLSKAKAALGAFAEVQAAVTMSRSVERSTASLERIYCSKADRRANPALARFCRALKTLAPLARRARRHLDKLAKASGTLAAARRALARAASAEFPRWRQAGHGAFPYGAVDAVEGGTAGGGLPYISADIGLLVPFFIENDGHVSDVGLAAYLGVNIYFTPIDKDTPLSLDDGFLKRFAVTVGFTVNDVEDADGTVEGVLFGKGVIFGAGFRITDHARLGLGAILVRQRDRNPAVDGKELKILPYAALSVDFDVASALKRAFTKEAKVLP